MARKLILPAEAKVCATCSYWDGERIVDPEVGVVIVEDAASGECLICECARRALLARVDEGCDWEHMAPDEVPVEEPPSEG